MSLLNANTYFGGATVEARVQKFWPRGIPVSMPDEIFRGLSVHAEVNHGRWIVKCPFEPCRGAQFADFQDRRFFCVECLHLGTAAEGKWLAVVVPRSHKRIEAQLLKRRPAYRNWIPGDDLVAENIENGVDTP